MAVKLHQSPLFYYRQKADRLPLKGGKPRLHFLLAVVVNPDHRLLPLRTDRPHFRPLCNFQKTLPRRVTLRSEGGCKCGLDNRLRDNDGTFYDLPVGGWRGVFSRGDGRVGD